MYTMKKILVIGAGRSTTYLLHYLAEKSEGYNWQITVADLDLKLAQNKCTNLRMVALKIDIQDDEILNQLVIKHDLIISMLPAHLHLNVAKACITHKVNMVTASYLSDEIKALHYQAKEAGITILNEIGVDPGLDHLSAMEIIHGIQSQGGQIEAFESFTGGLIAPESDNNPWNYKFTWNPRNVVLAGQGGAVKFIQNGLYKFIPYHKLFRRTEIIEIDNFGKFEGYANRDSLKYRETYGLSDVKTMFRGTLRRPGFCRAWDQFIQLGVTDDDYILPDTLNMTHREFINTFLSYNVSDSVEIKLRNYLRIEQDDVNLWERLEWLGLFDNTVIGIENASPARVLEHILKKKWTLKQTDKDMIVMWHKVNYRLDGCDHELHSSTVVIGEDDQKTAMAKTVGLPLAIGAKHLLTGEINEKGTILPIKPEIYKPILEELKEHGIFFNEKRVF
ncbi:MAG: saccharopine dehydrogenase-like NADP-dependent oxidoreductase [Bacteroidia bacterium]|jgi:saccharopine dehydrogenase-like NADP-dependent oxidoreductase